MIYFIKERETNYVKIGYTKNSVKKRLSNLQNGNPRELEILFFYRGDEEEELYLHSKFSGDRIRGEWFYLSNSIKIFLKDTKYKEDNNIFKHTCDDELDNEHLKLSKENLDVCKDLGTLGVENIRRDLKKYFKEYKISCRIERYGSDKMYTNVLLRCKMKEKPSKSKIKEKLQKYEMNSHWLPDFKLTEFQQRFGAVLGLHFEYGKFSD